MPRICALLLAMAISFQLMTPLLVASGPELPACCRKDGKHACGMLKAKRAPVSGTSLNAKSETCPQFPTGKSVAASGNAGELAAALTIAWQTRSRANKIADRKQALFRLSFARSLQKRGPPAVS